MVNIRRCASHYPLWVFPSNIYNLTIQILYLKLNLNV